MASKSSNIAPERGPETPSGGCCEKDEKKERKKERSTLEMAPFWEPKVRENERKKELFFRRFFHAVSTSFWGAPGSQSDAEKHLGGSKKVVSNI